MRLKQHIGEAVPVAVLRNFGGEHKEVGLTIRGEYLGLGAGASPLDPVVETDPLGLQPQPPSQCPAADVNKAPMKVGREKRKRFEQVAVALFCDRTPD